LGEPGWAKVQFLDEGEGIGEEAMERLFEPFFTTKSEGTGLGLALANRIVEAHGGRITCRNRPEGGAEFTVILPIGVGLGGREDSERETPLTV
jgi:signal transduction histidine kinase